jgi:hypothetical protein
LFLLKKWATASNIDLMDVLYSMKVLIAQKLTFYLKEQYHNSYDKNNAIKDRKIIPIEY